MILFDGFGKFTSTPFDVMPNSNLGRAIGLLPPTGSGTFTLYGRQFPLIPNAPPPSVYSQFGLVLYDREAFKGMQNAGTATPSDGDWLTQKSLPGVKPNTLLDEQNEETWLDRNAMPLLVNRYNGTLIKGE
jgi:hypothetical protein